MCIYIYIHPLIQPFPHTTTPHRFLIVREALPPEEKPSEAAPEPAPDASAAHAGKEKKGKKPVPPPPAKKGPIVAVVHFRCVPGKNVEIDDRRMGPWIHAWTTVLYSPPNQKKISFTVQGEFVDEMRGESSLVVWDVAIDHAARRKGLGRHLLVLLELIARRTRMRFLSLPVMNGDDATRDWCERFE